MRIGLSIFLFLAVALSSAAAAVTPEGLIAHWPFDGNANDISGNQFHGQLAGSVSFSDGPVGQALDLRGGEGWVDIPAAVLNQLESCSMSVWMNLASYDPGDPSEFCCNAIYNEDGFPANSLHNQFIVIDDPQTVGWVFGGLSGQQGKITAPPIDEWVHYVMTYSASDASYQIYENGTLAQQGTHDFGTTIPKCGSGTAATVGAWNQDGQGSMTRFFDGQIDDIRLYDRRLTAQDAAELALLGDLIAHWRFDGNLEDSTGNGFDLSYEGTGGPVFSPGVRGQAIDLRGVDSYLNVSGPDPLLDELPGCSIGAWINTASLEPVDGDDPCCKAILAEEGAVDGGLHFNLAMWLNPDSYEFIVLGSGIGRISVQVQEINAWVNLFYTYDSETEQQALYRNGVLVSEASGEGGQPPCGKGLGVTLGAWDSDLSPTVEDMKRFYDGKLDEIRVYGRALSEAEVQTLVDGDTFIFRDRFKGNTP